MKQRGNPLLTFKRHQVSERAPSFSSSSSLPHSPPLPPPISFLPRKCLDVALNANSTRTSVDAVPNLSFSELVARCVTARHETEPPRSIVGKSANFAQPVCCYRSVSEVGVRWSLRNTFLKAKPKQGSITTGKERVSGFFDTHLRWKKKRERGTQGVQISVQRCQPKLREVS